MGEDLFIKTPSRWYWGWKAKIIAYDTANIFLYSGSKQESVDAAVSKS